MRIIEHFDNGTKFYPDNIAFIDVGSDEPGVSYAQAQPLTQREVPIGLRASASSFALCRDSHRSSLRWRIDHAKISRICAERGVGSIKKGASWV